MTQFSSVPATILSLYAVIFTFQRPSVVGQLIERQVLRSLLRNFTEIAPLVAQANFQEKLREQVSLVTDDVLQLEKFPWPATTPFSSLSAHVYEDDKISTGVFLMREPGISIPLHDHKNMFGFIRVIRGQIRVESFSWLEAVEVNQLELEHKRNDTRARPVRYEGPRILSADEYGAHSVGFLGPMKGNVHSITALEKDTVFFDLLIPGYKHRRPRYFVLDSEDYLISGRVYWLRETLPSYTTGKWPYPQVRMPLVETRPPEFVEHRLVVHE
ncbi:cysteamine dioxygenase [Aphelenchoides avenae]|nr:cysteamine dioxygenase [Aphelenchus avenae]